MTGLVAFLIFVAVVVLVADADVIAGLQLRRRRRSGGGDRLLGALQTPLADPGYAGRRHRRPAGDRGAGRLAGHPREGLAARLWIHMTRYYPTAVGIAVALHWIWAAGLTLDPLSADATGPHAMLELVAYLFGGNALMAAAIFAVVGTMAAVGLVVRGRWWRLAFIAPQHAVLWVSAIGAINAMALAQFADGVTRTHWFLIVDQVLMVLIALGHLVAGNYLLMSDRYARPAV